MCAIPSCCGSSGSPTAQVLQATHTHSMVVLEDDLVLRGQRDAQWLKALTAFVEDLRMFSSTYMVVSSHL